jgi:CheY-like chemotaxis protein
MSDLLPISEVPVAAHSAMDLPYIRHELKTPINAIVGYSEILLEDAEDEENEALAKDLRKIRSAGHKLLVIIDDLLGTRTAEPQQSCAHTVAPQPIAHRHEDEPACVMDGRLLVVDDIEANREVLCRHLLRYGCRLETAENGREALEKLRTETFDLVLLDIMMPEMDGYETLAAMKAERDLAHIPVIMLTALDQLDSVVRCIEMGAEDYLPKPFNAVLLQARIGACLEKKRLRDLEIAYLRDVAVVTRAAAALEVGAFRAEDLETVAARQDELGQMARVMVKAGQEVQAREERLKRQVQELRIEIDQSRKQRQVAEITESDFFLQLEQKARELRRRG